MKLVKLICGFWLICVIFTSCKKEDLSFRAQLGKLPAATTTGENNFGALVDGIALKPEAGLYAPGLQVSQVYLKSSKYISINCMHRGKSDIQTITLQIGPLTDNFQNDLALGSDSLASFANYRFYTQTGDYYEFDTSDYKPGQVHITKYDPVSRILSGTFSFDAADDKGKMVAITHGRFDVTY